MLRSYLEVPDEATLAALDKANPSELRKRLFAAIIDQGYPGSKLEDICIVPRVIPRAYMQVIEDGCRRLTETLLALAAKERDLLLRHLVPDSRWRKLLGRHALLESVPRRMAGELRYDFAICGPLTEDNPPQLMEVNAGALGGMAYASFLPKLMKALVPGLEHLTGLDVAENLVTLFRRIGPHIANFCLGGYSWGEHLIAQACDGAVSFHLLAPAGDPDAEKWPGLRRAAWRFNGNGKLSARIGSECQDIDGFRWGRVLEHGDIDRYGTLLKGVEACGATDFISPPRVDYVCHKGVLPLLRDSQFLSETLGVEDCEAVRRYVPRTWKLSERGLPPRAEYGHYVLKQNFGCSGKKVFVGEAIREMEGRIEAPDEWILQERLELNQMLARLMYSQDQPMRMDLGVFVHYDWCDGELAYYKLAGLLCRASQQLRVNLNLGGASVPVLISE